MMKNKILAFLCYSLLIFFATIVLSQLIGIPTAASFCAIMFSVICLSSMPYKGYLNSFLFPIRFNYKATEEGAGGDDEKAQKLIEKIKSELDKDLSTRGATKENIDEMKSIIDKFKDLPLDALRDMANDKTGALALVKQLNVRMEKLETEGKGGEKPLSVREQIKAWRDENKDALQKLANKQKAELTPLEIRAVASPMLPSTVMAGGTDIITRYAVEPGINDIPRYAWTLWNTLKKGKTSAETYFWLNKTTPQGSADFIAPGVLKPKASFSLVKESSHAKKVAITEKVATELLQDIDGFADLVENDLRVLLYTHVNDQVMLGTSSATDIAGIQSLSTTYTLTTVKTVSPNYMDALRALIAQLRSGKLNGEITIFINPVDSANMDLAKSGTGGVYLIPPFMSADGKRISGATIIEDNNIPIGHVQAALLDYYVIKIYQGYSVQWGWENDDFTKNLLTALAEMRLHQIFNDQYTGAFIYDTFDNIITALTPA